jgi:hypothetical protein
VAGQGSLAGQTVVLHKVHMVLVLLMHSCVNSTRLMLFVLVHEGHL